MNKNQKMSVKKGEDGLPTAFRILAPGALHYTLKDASSCVATITENDVKDMADWHASKGVRLPIDCEHYVHYITRLVGVTEDDFRDRFPTARGILGDCVIAMHDGELWADDVRFFDNAKPFLQSAMLNYFSPVIYNLEGKGKKKLTSIALTANPAINHSEPLVASDADKDAGIRVDPIILSDCSDNKIETPKQERKTPKMNKLLEYLKDWLGMECPAEMDDAKSEEVIAAIKAKIDAQKAENATALSDVEKECEALRDQVRVLSDRETATSLNALITQGMSEGKLTAAQEAWARKQTPSALSDFLATAPVVVPGRLDVKKEPAKDEPTTLSDDQRKIAEACGLTEDEFIAQLNPKKG